MAKPFLQRLASVTSGVSAALFVGGGLAWYQTTGTTISEPSLVVSPQIVALGHLSPGERRLVKLQVTARRGTLASRIIGAPSVCDQEGCITVMGLPLTIWPGTSSTLEVEFIGTRPGPIARELPLFTDAPGQTEIRLLFSGEVAGRE
jgi:hypothetical protein